ncbi:hypothetical protein NDU88_005086 [Pleurodeles waltl]|uniref:Uncharacterized protein n=1 Tax=Pleurodeles waltl TaxID=8319 RepID=A0AAV7SKM9_PLEWA|nr:hypothetical protein NDU88_005086 [Pleurodeles waltl]
MHKRQRGQQSERRPATAPQHPQALQEMQDSVDVAAALNKEDRDSPHPSEPSLDRESNNGSASISSLVASDIMPKTTPGTSDEIL